MDSAISSDGRDVPRRLAWRAHRVMLRTGEGPLRPFWWLAHEALARAVAHYLRGSDRATTSAYLQGSLGRGEPVFGVSDIDLVIVVEGDGFGASTRVSQRWTRLSGWLPMLCAVMLEPPRVYGNPRVHGARELAVESKSTTLTHGLDNARHGTGERAAVEPSLRERAGYLDGTERPRLYGLTNDWRLIGGRDRRPIHHPEGGAQRRIRAWMELQFWWLQAFRGCAEPDAAWIPYLFVKLITEPARIWLWLVRGERVRERAALIEAAIRELPDEEPALRAAGEVYGNLSHSPRVPLSEALHALTRMSGRIAQRLETEIEGAASTRVRLLGGELPEVVVPSRLIGALKGAAGVDQPVELKPLADWRARVWSLLPDEVFTATRGDPSDVARIGATARTGNDGAYAAWRTGQLLILPSLKRARLRGVQCPPTDPVSFALVEGSTQASFPEMPGWSARDSARRAAAEHLGWLRAGAGSAQPGSEVLARLLTAARAALFLESVENGAPQLAVTVAAAADLLDQSSREHSTLAREAYESYREARLDGDRPGPDIVAALRHVVERMPTYGEQPISG